MTPETQFDQAFDAAMQDRRDLVQFLHGVSESQARWQPPDGEWSILQGLEHIMLTETYFLENFLKVLHEAEANDHWDNSPAHPTKMSPEALRRREQGFVAAPDRLIPRGDRHFVEMRQALIAEREASRNALLPYRTRDLSRLVIPHAVYGERHLYDVITYAGIHDYLHREQMQRVVQQADYPTA
jgi:uncharacterized damage-inducible protein DinB